MWCHSRDALCDPVDASAGTDRQSDRQVPAPPGVGPREPRADVVAAVAAQAPLSRSRVDSTSTSSRRRRSAARRRGACAPGRRSAARDRIDLRRRVVAVELRCRRPAAARVREDVEVGERGLLDERQPGGEVGRALAGKPAMTSVPSAASGRSRG